MEEFFGICSNFTVKLVGQWVTDKSLKLLKILFSVTIEMPFDIFGNDWTLDTGLLKVNTI